MYPYAPILFDYIRRAMPMDRPQTLTPNEVYALSAYILNLNGLVPANAVMDAKTLPTVQMPNRERLHRRRPAGRQGGTLHDELQVDAARGAVQRRPLPGRRFSARRCFPGNTC